MITENRGVVKDNNINASYLINNAGMGDAGLFEKSDIQKDENIIRLNVLTLMRMNRLFIPYLRENGGGTIVNFASTLAFAPTAGEAVYAASKAFVLSFSQALYEETKKSNVSVLTICPGVTDTDFFKSAGVFFYCFLLSHIIRSTVRTESLCKNAI